MLLLVLLSSHKEANFSLNLRDKTDKEKWIFLSIQTEKIPSFTPTSILTCLCNHGSDLVPLKNFFWADVKMSEKNEGRQVRMNWKFLDLAWLRALPSQKIHNVVGKSLLQIKQQLFRCCVNCCILSITLIWHLWTCKDVTCNSCVFFPLNCQYKQLGQC